VDCRQGGRGINTVFRFSVSKDLEEYLHNRLFLSRLQPDHSISCFYANTIIVVLQKGFRSQKNSLCLVGGNSLTSDDDLQAPSNILPHLNFLVTCNLKQGGDNGLRIHIIQFLTIKEIIKEMMGQESPRPDASFFLLALEANKGFLHRAKRGFFPGQTI